MPFKCKDKAREYGRLLGRKKREQQREINWQERELRILNRKSPKLSDRIWAAGHFEGEGTITLGGYGAKPIGGARVVATLTSTDKEVIDFFQDRWPGSVRVFQPKSKNGLAKPAFVWRIGHNEMVEGFILDLQDHLRRSAVKQKFDLVLADLRDRIRHQQNRQAQARTEVRRLEIRRLNHRGTGNVPTAYLLEGPKR